MFTTMDDDGNVSLVEEPSAEYGYTYADYLTWKFEERLELFRGKIFKMGAPNTKHQQVSSNLHVEIGSYLKNKPCMVFTAPYDVRLPVMNKKKDNEITTVLQPDLGIVCDLAKIDEKGVIGAPDFVVEILSPGNPIKEIRHKYELYEEAGVKEYWVISPVEENIIAYRLNSAGRFEVYKILIPGDVVSLLAVPGLQINIADIFMYKKAL